LIIIERTNSFSLIPNNSCTDQKKTHYKAEILKKPTGKSIFDKKTETAAKSICEKQDETIYHSVSQSAIPLEWNLHAIIPPFHQWANFRFGGGTEVLYNYVRAVPAKTPLEFWLDGIH